VNPAGRAATLAIGLAISGCGARAAPASSPEITTSSASEVSVRGPSNDLPCEGTWHTWELPRPARAIASDGNEVVVVGDGGLAARWTGAGWESEPVPVSADILGVAFDDAGIAWGVGRAGLVVRRQHGSWAQVDRHIPGDLLSVVAGHGAVIAGGSGSTLFELGDFGVIEIPGPSGVGRITAVQWLPAGLHVAADDRFFFRTDSGWEESIQMWPGGWAVTDQEVMSVAQVAGGEARTWIACNDLHGHPLRGDVDAAVVTRAGFFVLSGGVVVTYTRVLSEPHAPPA
jgi:hypothetical protein